MPERVRLLAGSIGPERTPRRPDPHDSDWFLPLHLRDPQAARERIVSQVEAGADVVMAPTWLTHRRALLPLGETRRAGEWTASAVRLAREAVEIGLERRAEALAQVPAEDPGHDRPRPLVAASLPALDDDPDPGSGKMLPSEAATERDYREQAGWLADAEPDAILVEGQRTESAARAALIEALETGLPTWAAMRPDALRLSGTEGWLDWCQAAGVARLLFPPPLESRMPAADGPLPWGVVGPEPEAVTDWLDAGATTVALADGATVKALARLRSAVDEHERASLERERAQRQRWRSHARRAAAMAPGGPAAQVGSDDDELPEGFEWHRVDRADLRHLPADHFRLVLDAAGVIDAGTARVLERGGIAAAQPGPVEGLRLVVLDDSAAPPLAIYRRED